MTVRQRSEPGSAVRSTDGARERWLVAGLGALSAILYGVVYASQRALFRNGLGSGFGDLLPGGVAADQALLRTQSATYYGAMAGLIALYVGLLVLCRRGYLQRNDARVLALALPVLFHLALLFGRPYLSIDLFSYMAHGYLGNQPAGNPYLQPAAQAGETPFGPALMAYGWIPVHPQSPYGPLWTLIEVGAMRLTQQVPVALVLLKLVVVAASLGCAALIWLALGRFRPQDQLMGTLLYLWNPVILIEFAAEGHNDAVMILFVLAALVLGLMRRPTGGLVALALGILTKYLPLIFLPAQLVYFWRTRASAAQVLMRGGLSVVVAILVGWLLYAPLWAGSATFDGVRNAGQVFESASPSGLVFQYLARTRDAEQAARMTSIIMGGIFGVLTLLLSWRVTDRDRLISSCALIALAYLFVASPGYWPWYVALPIALLALVPRGAYLWMALVLTVTSRAVAPISDFAANGFLDWTRALNIISAVGVSVPAVLGLLIGLWHWQVRRSSHEQVGQSEPIA